MNTIDTENSLGITFCERLEISFVRGKGSIVWDEAGREYLDFTAGWGVTCLGHSHPVIIEAINAQAQRIMQNPNAGFTYSPYRAALLALMKTILPANMNKVYFCNSGAEANDAALKLARKITGRPNIVTTLGAFHGRTWNTLQVTRGKENAARFRQENNDSRFVPFGDVAAMANTIDGQTAAVILEPIQGEGGIQVPPADYLHRVQDLCREHGALFIVDEIQTGFCRTGTFFALEHSPVAIAPDILTLGKGIAGGFPFAAFAVNARVDASLDLDDHGGTYCGNPLGCAVSSAVVHYLKQHEVAGRVASLGAITGNRLDGFRQAFPALLRDVRGKGLLWALEFHDHGLTRPITRTCAERGLLVVPTRNGIIRLLPDLLVSREDLDRGLSMLAGVLAEYGRG